MKFIVQLQTLGFLAHKHCVSKISVSSDFNCPSFSKRPTPEVPVSIVQLQTLAFLILSCVSKISIGLASLPPHPLSSMDRLVAIGSIKQYSWRIAVGRYNVSSIVNNKRQ